MVLIGSTETRTVARPDGGVWVYTPRGYAGKASSQMRGGPCPAISSAPGRARPT